MSAVSLPADVLLAVRGGDVLFYIDGEVEFVWKHAEDYGGFLSLREVLRSILPAKAKRWKKK